MEMWGGREGEVVVRGKKKRKGRRNKIMREREKEIDINVKEIRRGPF